MRAIHDDNVRRDAVLEVGVEEIPARSIGPALEDLKRAAEDLLEQAGLCHGRIGVSATPRRLVLYIERVAARGEDVVEEVRGPSEEVAFDDRGNPTAAAEGFARGQGMTVNDLVLREEAHGRYLYAVKSSPGRSATGVLPEVMEGALDAVEFDRTMRWGEGEFSFIRPVRWVLALWGDEVLPVEIFKKTAGRCTFGPRFAPREIEVKCAEELQQVLAESYVILDPDRRKRNIVDAVRGRAREAGGRAVLPGGLLEEVTFLVEYPAVLRGGIPERYMEIPRVIVQTAMQSHLRFFPVEDADGELLPCFISVLNGTPDMVDSVRSGNELVLNSRLADAEFFWREDAEHSLEEYARDLDELVLHERLGSFADKTRRLENLAERLRSRGLVGGELFDILTRACRLCKADLLTQTVFEFPSLQGRIGEELAQLGSEPEGVAGAIGEHYLPEKSEDPLPETPAGRWLSLLDKTDDLVGGFRASLEASGSEDPYGLRRAAIGILRLLKQKDDVSLHWLLQATTTVHGLSEGRSEDTVREILGFVRRRLKGLLVAEGYDREIIDGVLARGFDDIPDVHRRVGAVRELIHSGSFEEFLTVWRRCHNLSPDECPEGVDSLLPGSFPTEEGEALCSNFLKIRDETLPALTGGRYREFFLKVVELKPSVDRFLDKIMVMVDDAELRTLRQSLLFAISEYLSRPADWSVLLG